MRNALRNRKGQSTVEYVIVFTAVVAVIIWASLKAMKPAAERVYNEAGQKVNVSGGLFGNKIGGNNFGVD